MEMSGPGGTHTFWAKIHDFSDRINSILVPNEFIKWANQNIAKIEDAETSRIIIKSQNTSDPELQKFINSKGYSTNQELLGASKLASLFKLILGFEFFQGALIFLLSIFLILMSTLLLVEKNKRIIYKLRIMGFSSEVITNIILNTFYHVLAWL